MDTGFEKSCTFANKRFKTMRTLFSLLLFLLISINGFAQFFNQYNSASRTAIIEYTKDKSGFYQKRSNINVDNVTNIISIYAFDKKKNKLYVATSYGNYVITLIESEAKIAKKNKSIPKLKETEIEALVMSVNNSLETKFAQLNIERELFVADSIEYDREQARYAALEKARLDSIENARNQSKINDYKSAHNWHWIPITPDNNTYKYTNSIDLKCDLCEEVIHSYSQDSIFACAIHNDTIYSLSVKTGYLDNQYYHIHRYSIPNILKSSTKFQEHINIYSDSLTNDTLYKHDIVDLYNSHSFIEYTNEVKKQAPYGFFVDWGWDDDYSSISFHFDYMNLNKRTIKYIDVYWKVSNGVGDVRKTGHFKGTGPLQEYESANWNWDYSSYYVAGDATEMEITKVIITYMNGQQQVLTGKQIKFN